MKAIRKSYIPAIDGKVAPNRSDKSRLDQYLAANREIKSVETLSNEAFIKVAEQIKSEVEKFAYYYVK